RSALPNDAAAPLAHTNALDLQAAVVVGAFPRILEDVIGGGDLLEAPRGGSAGRIEVGVIRLGEPSKSVFHGVGVGARRYAEDVVQRHPRSPLAGKTGTWSTSPPVASPKGPDRGPRRPREEVPRAPSGRLDPLFRDPLFNVSRARGMPSSCDKAVSLRANVV